MEMILKYFTDFTVQQLQQLKALDHLYREWNNRINVISRKDIDGLYEKHVLHSLSIAAVFHFAEGTKIVDIGTGGGFPGIPLSIFFPDVKFHLIDSVAKKLKVVEAIATAIGSDNITTQHVRVEELKDRRDTDSAGRGKFDFAVSRAAGSLKELWNWSKPLLRSRQQDMSSKKLQIAGQRPGLICLKGGDLAKEIRESLTRPHITEIFEIFPEPYFREKYILYVPC